MPRDGAPGLSIRLAALQGGPFVVAFLSASDTNLKLYQTLYFKQCDWYRRESGLSRADKFIKLPAVEEEFSGPGGIGGSPLACRLVRGHMGIREPGLAFAHRDKGAFQACVTCLDAFYFGAGQDKPGDEALGKLVVKTCAAVLCEEFHIPILYRPALQVAGICLRLL